MTENRVSKFEDGSIVFIPSKQHRKIKLEKNEENFNDLYNNNKISNILTEWEEKQSGAERIFKETMAENFPIFQQKINKIK